MRRGGLMRARGSLVVFGWDGRDMYDSAVLTNLITTCCGVVLEMGGSCIPGTSAAAGLIYMYMYLSWIETRHSGYISCDSVDKTAAWAK